MTEPTNIPVLRALVLALCALGAAAGLPPKAGAQTAATPQPAPAVEPPGPALPTFRDERRWSGAKTPGAAPQPQAGAPVPSAAAGPTAPALPAASAGKALPAKSVTGRAPAHPALKKLGDAPCGPPIVTTTPLDAGFMRVAVASSCRGGQDVVWSYGGAEQEARLDAAGHLQIPVDCFAGATSTVDLTFADGTQFSLPITANDLDKVAKVAVIWRSPVNLDLHAFEYAARTGQPGHVWPGAASSLEASRERLQKTNRSAGYVSSHSRGDGARDKVEVYTHVHKDGQVLGAISLALDFETRGTRPSGATCVGGAQAEVAFRVVTLSRHGHVGHESGLIAAAPCDGTLSDAARFHQAVLPVLKLR